MEPAAGAKPQPAGIGMAQPGILAGLMHPDVDMKNVNAITTSKK